MDRRELALEEAKTWEREALIPAGSVERIQRWYGAQPAAAHEDGWGSLLLYALGGILLGAASVAFGFLLDIAWEDEATWTLLFAVWGSAALGIAIVCSHLRREGPADALAICALVAFGLLGLPQADQQPFGFVGMAAGIGALFWRRHRQLPAALGVGAFVAGLVAICLWAFDEPIFGNTDGFEAGFLVGAVAYLALVLATPRFLKCTWRHEVAALATAGAAIGWVLFTVENLDLEFSGGAEIVIGIGLIALLAAAIPMREKGVAVVATAGIAVDAIVFAFDVGNEWGGFLTLIAFAVLFITQAGLVRRFLRV